MSSVNDAWTEFATKLAKHREMVCVAGEGQGILEIWDLSRGGDHPLKKSLEISQNLEIGKLVFQVSYLCEHKIGSFGLILQWDRVKIDLMEVRRDLTLNDIGVDFTSGSTYSLLITEWPSSPSEGDEQTMPYLDGGGPSVLLEILDLSRGDFARSNLEVGPAARVIDLFHYAVLACNHKAGTFGLILRYGRNKVELNDKDTRKLTEIGVDLSSPSSVMLLVTETAEPPSAETGTKTSTSTEDYPPAMTSPEIDQTQDRSQEGVYADLSVHERKKARETYRPAYDGDGETETEIQERAREKRINAYDETYKPAYEGDGETETDIGGLVSNPVVAWQPQSANPRNAERKTFRRQREGEKYKVFVNKSSRIEQENEDNEPNRRSETTYVGLVNQAMTCYLNSLIQALYMTPEFRNALYSWEYPSGSEKDEITSIPYQLQKLFLNLQTSSKNAIETTSLTKSFGWDSTEAWQQHDIQELCRVMFDALEQKFKKTDQADLINRLYEGKMIDYVKCLECGTEKSREDTFLDIPLPVKPFGSNVAYNSVEEALAAFVQPETLDGANQYHCETCNKKCDAHKGLKFTKFPYLLTLHLKRFDFDYNTFHRIKLNDEVTFPDVLNLNSFIPSTASQDSPCAEEDNGVDVKCDDSSTTDSGTLDDEGPPCDNGMSVSDHSTNHDQDYDEGINMSNGPSTSSYSGHNHDNEKNRGNRPGPSGPYEYELFSIMIHSGSASGGHYYAYIKDFRTGEWLCFNDQNVSPITDDDIQKTYGGGPTRAYYSGVYSSSTNAYMLMYRQVDPVRNALPMQVTDFPKHLQELLTKMQENEYNDIKSHVMMNQMPKLKVICHLMNEKINTRVACCAKMFCQHEETWGELTERAYKALCIDNRVDQDLVRLVTYQESTGMIDCSFDGREDELVTNLLTDQTELLMEIRKKDEKFKTYLPGGLQTKVYIVDVTKKEVVKGPITVRGVLTQTVLEYKEQLGEVLGMEPKDIHLILQFPSNPTTRLVANNDTQLQFEGFNGANKIIVPTISDADSTKSIQDSIPEIMEVFGSLISLNFELPDTSKEALRGLSIPSLEEIDNEKPVETPVTNGPTKLSSTTEGRAETVEKSEANSATPPTKVAAGEEGFWNETTSPPAAQPEGEEWHTPEQSNSEDSSLSYSDRTLVGEGDASEDDDYPLAGVDHEFFGQTEQENWDAEDAREHFFKATLDEGELEKMLRVLVDKRMSLGALKKLLEPFVGVPAEYFKIFRQCGSETECSRLSAPMNFHEDGEVLTIKLGRALRSGEFKVKLHQLIIDSDRESYKFLCEWIVSKEATVGQTKKEILVELSRKFDLDIPIERCRLRRKNYKTASKVFLDEQKFKDLNLYWPFEIIVQELPGKEPVTDPNDVVLFVRRVMKPDVFLGPIEEIVVSGKSNAEVREKLSEISGIPEEFLEMAKGKSTMAWDLMVLMFETVLEWNRQTTPPDNRPPMGFDDGSFIYYRDWREKVDDPNAKDSQHKVKAKSHMLGISSSSRYSPRRERALKIYVDDK